MTGRTSRGRKLVQLTVSVALLTLAASAFAEGDAWDRKENRFQALPAFANQAVLDTETGLVWERAPSAGAFTWGQAHDRCNRLVLGARMAWRVPTLQELTSLLDIGAPNNLTPGHPFVVLPPWNIGEAIWSATTSASNATNAWGMNLASTLTITPKGSLSHAWCVRFRQGVDPQ